jgi:protein-S-isoprenylcysteine O-methyltransferase Ste14
MMRPNEDPSPNDKKLRFGSFAIHATRGLVRDQKARRKTMFVIVVVALVMLSCGATFLAPLLDPHERPGWFTFYWVVCGWVTVTAVLLAALDLLLVRAQVRAERRKLAEKLAEDEEA